MKILNILKDTTIFTNTNAFTKASKENTVVYTTVYYKIFLGSIIKNISLKDTNFSSAFYFIPLSLKFWLLSS
jgi:hypothetical protein